MNDNVTQLRSEPDKPETTRNGNGGGGSYGERLARLEAEVDNIKLNMATKTDIANMKVWILSGVLGGMGIAALVTVGILRFFTEKV